RTTAAVEDLVSKHPKGKVAVVSHSDVIRVLLANYLGMPLDLVHRLDVLPASVSIIDLPKGGPPRVSVINHVADIERWR
ncbi:MAG: histidine phosphatase family protein, partial [Acidimicrobiia bacterium]|nr:histidine phosphatase family protein [Acidimicrobiia bacterium]